MSKQLIVSFGGSLQCLPLPLISRSQVRARGNREDVSRIRRKIPTLSAACELPLRSYLSAPKPAPITSKENGKNVRRSVLGQRSVEWSYRLSNAQRLKENVTVGK
jgi:hypothetical protein